MSHFEPHTFQIIILLLASTAAGWIDSIAGGGGLITMPVLLYMGLPVKMVLGTNKLQGAFGSLVASHRYSQAGMITIKSVLPGAFFALLGGALGSFAVQKLGSAALVKIIPFLLAAAAVYILLTPDLHKERKARLSKALFFPAFGIGLGFYDGFFGPGTGTLMAAALVILGGFNLMSATGYTKAANFASNIASLAVFMLNGNVIYEVAAIMMIGQLIGSRIGSSMAAEKGVGIIKPVLVGVSLIMAVSLFFKR
ncbi:MAG: TSUP family transporter [Elusimicrobia bacterium]|nr:TSUP family transporter [Elusimicrobiota bacterium]